MNLWWSSSICRLELFEWFFSKTYLNTSGDNVIERSITLPSSIRIECLILKIPESLSKPYILFSWSTFLMKLVTGFLYDIINFLGSFS